MSPGSICGRSFPVRASGVSVMMMSRYERGRELGEGSEGLEEGRGGIILEEE